MGNKKQTILILNGRHYNALTGEAVSDGKVQAVRPISDMVGSSSSKSAPLAIAQSRKPEPLKPLGSMLMDVSRSTGHTKPRQQQRANTLIRSAVTPPKPGFRSQTVVSAPVSKALAPIATVSPKWSISQVNPRRQTRAGLVGKSEAITKFAPGSDVPYEVQNAAVRVSKPESVSIAPDTVPQDSNELFARAIASAESHNEKPIDQKKLSRQARKQAKKAGRPVHQHLASVVAASLTVLVLGGLVGLQNKDSITLRFANAQAGFNAKLPTYQPSGYGVGNFTYSAGAVGTTFHSDATNHDYTLEQQTTKWDSQALLDNFITVNYPKYQALQSGDQVIYMYGKNDASWVKDGVWYQVTSNGSLSTSQVLNIATSV